MTVLINMDEGVKEWLEKKGQVLTISQREARGCCSGYEDLDISYKKPRNDNYELYEQDDLSIYLQKNLPIKDGKVKLSLMGKSIFTTLYIGGIGIG